MPIESAHDISVIVQGAVDPQYTSICLNRIRYLLPGAEIILATQLGMNTERLNYDRLVLTTDPGNTVADEVAKIGNNVNRQLLTTQEGLKVATKPYALKLRSDILLEGDDFVRWFEHFENLQTAIFKKRILICNYYTRNPRIFPCCFHPSDWIAFGFTEDLRKFFSAPLQTEEEAYWFKTHNKQSEIFKNYLPRFTPEQHICIHFLRQYEEIQIDDYYDRSKNLILQTERMLADCFVVLDYQKQLKMHFPKYNPNRYYEKHTLISHWQWKALYQRYSCNRPSLLYLCYRVRASIIIGVYAGRIVLLRVLNVFHLKEPIKRALNKQKWLNKAVD